MQILTSFSTGIGGGVAGKGGLEAGAGVGGGAIWPGVGAGGQAGESTRPFMIAIASLSGMVC